MSQNVIKVFEECLNSNLSCDDVYNKMKQTAVFKINKNVEEKMLFSSFFLVISKYFPDVLKMFTNDKLQIEFSHKNVFGITKQIAVGREKYKKNNYYKEIVLFYKTFYFCEIIEKDESNDFTFYVPMPDGSELPKEFEIYLLNIGLAILKKNSVLMFQILFSEDTPLYFINIIMICFLYTRYKKRNASDFVELCVPFLNHYNLLYLHDLINNEFNYQFNYRDQIIYKDLENFLLSLNVPNVNSISTYEEPKEIIINLVKDKNENIIKLNIDEEAIVKYFNLPDEDDKAKEFFTDKNFRK